MCAQNEPEQLSAPFHTSVPYLHKDRKQIPGPNFVSGHLALSAERSVVVFSVVARLCLGVVSPHYWQIDVMRLETCFVPSCLESGPFD